MNEIIKNLQVFYTEKISYEKVELPKNSQVIAILANRSFYKIKIGTVTFIGIIPRLDESFSVSTYKKHLGIYIEKFENQCAYILYNPTEKQTDSFIKNKIPFITNDNQIYLSFLGICFNRRAVRIKEINSEKMMPVTQSVFLYMFYKKQKYYLKSEIASELKISRTSLTRASEQLCEMKLIVQTKVGKEYRMELITTGIELYKLAKNYLINPIYEEFYVENSELILRQSVKAGVSALAECSMINSPKINEVAIFKDNEIVESLKKIDIRWDEYENPVKIQLWKYPPQLFEIENRVDIISLICSFNNIEDERIEGEIEEIIRNATW